MSRRPTVRELIAAGWQKPPPPPPRLADLLRELRQIGPDHWVAFDRDADKVLRRLHRRKPHLLRYKVTKRDGEMWRIAE